MVAAWISTILWWFYDLKFAWVSEQPAKKSFEVKWSIGLQKISFIKDTPNRNVIFHQISFQCIKRIHSILNFAKTKRFLSSFVHWQNEFWVNRSNWRKADRLIVDRKQWLKRTTSSYYIENAAKVIFENFEIKGWAVSFMFTVVLSNLYKSRLQYSH